MEGPRRLQVGVSLCWSTQLAAGLQGSGGERAWYTKPLELLLREGLERKPRGLEGPSLALLDSSPTPDMLGRHLDSVG